MSYHWFNRQEILQKAKEGCSKEKAAEYYLKIKEAIKEKSREQWKTCYKKKKTRLKSTKKSIKNWFSIKKKCYKINNFCFLLRIKRTSEKTLKFNNNRVNKKEFHKPKQPIGLISVNTEHIVTSDKFKHSDKDFKYFISCQEDAIVKPLCIILPQIVDT